MTARAIKVISNTAVSLDGRIDARGAGMLGSAEDRRRMGLIRQRADAVLVGGATFRRWPTPSLPAAPPPAPPWNVVVTRTLDVPLTPKFLAEPRIRPLFLTRAEVVPAGFPAEIEGYAGADLPVPWILDALARRGVRTLLLEAGGDLLYQFVAAGALDEVYLTLCPLLVGDRSAASLVSGPGFPLPLPSLRLQESEVVGDEIFLRYLVAR